MLTLPKPDWIKVRLPSGPSYTNIQGLLRERKLHTVCEEARCPNIAECWGGGTATIMLLGDTCTRGCRFCAVTTGNPKGIVDEREPEKAAETVQLMELKYVVMTSVDRDDLPDQGAGHFAKTIRTVHEKCPGVKVEALIPDFRGDETLIRQVLNAKPDVLAHNLETVERLTSTVRDRRATYGQSLNVLCSMKKQNPRQWTKSSIMLGLGETRDELRASFAHLREAGVDFLTLGQYLQPSKKHLAVIEFVTPQTFEELRLEALEFGFRYVASGPLVRSSYKAGEFFVHSLIERGEVPS